jgi:hypothetical protein
MEPVIAISDDEDAGLSAAPDHPRVCAVDLGNQNNGLVVAQLTPQGVVILHMECIQMDVKQAGVNHVAQTILAQIAQMRCSRVFYENATGLRNHKSSRNHNLRRLQNELKRQCGVAGMASTGMLPHKKYGLVPGGNNRNRKSASTGIATQWMAEHQPQWLETFGGMPRKHDVADALLMLLFVAQEEGSTAP